MSNSAPTVVLVHGAFAEASGSQASSSNSWLTESIVLPRRIHCGDWLSTPTLCAPSWAPSSAPSCWSVIPTAARSSPRPP